MALKHQSLGWHAEPRGLKRYRAALRGLFCACSATSDLIHSLRSQGHVPKTSRTLRKKSPRACAALQAQRSLSEAKGVRIWLNPRDSQPWTTGAQIRKTFWLPVCTRSGVDYRKSVPGTAHLRLHPPDGRPQPLVCCRPTWPRGRGDGLSDLREVHPG